MYKLLIVEDERWEREGLVALMDCERYNISEILVAENGVEGLECIRQKRPDIIITDIRIPGFTGLEMLEQARDLVQQSVCIILSGYNEFGYAQQALRIGAMDFLVKPVNVDELHDCMEQAVASLKKRKKPEGNASMGLERVLSGQLTQQEIREVLGVQTLVGLRAAVYSGMNEGVVVPLFSHRTADKTVILLRSQDKLPTAGFEAAGIARVEREDGLAIALQQAERAMQLAAFHRLEAPLMASEIDKNHLVNPLRQCAERIALEQAMASLEEDRVREVIQTVRRRMMQDIGLDRAQAMEQLSELVSKMEDAPEEELSFAYTLDAMLDILQAKLLERIKSMRQKLSEPECYVVRRIIQLVTENYYNPDVNLQALAGQIFLSPNYVGSLFKKSTGVSFSDYLCRHRLMQAERLLVEQGMRVSAVAEAVGIPNVSYFCVQFRNAYGVTPSNYKKKH